MADIPVERIEITPSNKTVEPGKSLQLTAKVYPENASNQNLVWFTDTGPFANITLDNKGLVTGRLVGRTTVTVKASNGVTATASVNVVTADDAVLAEWITVYPGSLPNSPVKLEIGDKQKFTASIYPSYATYKGIVWTTSQDGILSIDKDGNVTALKKGNTAIMVISADNNAEKWTYITVVDPNEKSSSSSSGTTNAYPVGIQISRTKIIIHTEQTLQIEGSVLLSNGQLSDNIGYSQSGEGSINFQGLMGFTDNDPTRNIYNIRGSHLGDLEATFFASKDKAIRQVVPVSVVYRGNETSTEKKPVKGLAITGKLELEVGERGVIKHTVAPFNASNQKVRYASSNNSIATVDSNGNVTAISNGKASIVVTTIDNNYSLTCDVYVGKQDYSIITGVELSKYQLVLAKGEVEQVKAYVIAEGKYDTAGVTCGSSNSSVASLASQISHSSSSNQSLITIKANAVGNATFTVRSITDTTKYATLDVTVVEAKDEVYTPVLYVQTDPTSISVPVNTEFVITGQAVLDLPEAYPSRYSARVTFSSSNSAVANIVREYTSSSTIKYCRIQAGSTPGQATITVTSNDDSRKTATCIVYVGQATPGQDGTITNPVQSVSISPKQIELAVGDYYQLNATVLGQFTDRSITNPKVIWSSNNSNVYVNDFGRIQAIKVGASIVTAVSQENHSLYDYCSITVRERTDDDGPIINPDDEQSGGIDTIVRIDYDSNGNFEYNKLFEGDLGFSLKNPIESVVYHETEDIQKIYWVDGKNVLRFMNFMEEADKQTGLYPWQYSANSYDNTYFDSNRQVNFGVDVSISKDNSGNTRPNGVVQYILTYYNKHGQETGYVWTSDLVYLSPVSSGGSADGTNNNSVTLTINNLDERFSYFRVYSIFRSALNGTPVAYIVFEGKTDGREAVVIDNNSHLTAVDAKQLLYLGSQNVIAGTLTHKDQTLFLGDLSSVGRDYDDVEELIKSSMIVPNTGLSNCIVFENDTEEILNETGEGNYVYNSQLVNSSSEITSFKGGEKYRFAISFRKKDGSMTDAFWIGDAVNKKYPIISDTGIRRVIAKCFLPGTVVEMMRKKGYMTAQLMIAEATYADRAIKAQGIVCPTVFSVWNRYMNRVYAASSWMMRPRNAEYAWRHFEPIHNSVSSTGEIDCNYWETEDAPNPYYALKNYDTTKEYVETFDVHSSEFDYAIIIYGVNYDWSWYNDYNASAIVVLVKGTVASFGADVIKAINEKGKTTTIDIDDGKIQVTNLGWYGSSKNLADSNKSKEAAWSGVVKAIREQFDFFDPDDLVDKDRFFNWCSQIPNKKTTKYFNYQSSGSSYASVSDALNGATSSGKHIDLVEASPSLDVNNYIPSYKKKHLMFIDENVVTLNSPEVEYEAISFDKIDGCKFRIIGVAPIDGNYSDYTVEASHGKKSGENLSNEKIVKTLIAWPLWREFGLDERTVEEGGNAADPNDAYKPSADNYNRDSYDYVWGGSVVYYWLRMWNHSGKILGFTDYNNNDYSRLIHKTFANARFSYKTLYNRYGNWWVCPPSSVRIFNYTSSQYVSINIGDSNESVLRNYDGIINDSLSTPRNHKYPVIWSAGVPDVEEVINMDTEPKLYLSDPVPITYNSSAHAVIALPTTDGTLYEQTILPRLSFEEPLYFDRHIGTTTGALLPWIDNTTTDIYPYKDYSVSQDTFSSEYELDSTKQYVYIGELYSDLPDNDEIRYGGTSDAAIQNNRFLIAGPQVSIYDMRGNGSDVLVANQGDTYIQRWDCLKTKPYSSDAVNNVVDITSVMLETHINIDGRTDLQRGTSYIASIDAEKFGQLNPVYSQANNFITQRDLDEDFNLDAYRSSITWTLEKHDSADIDEWTHITLASTLKLDGDKGVCQALRRFGNSIIAFQDRGISEILFNSRTQLTTQDGVPVEIANSGKVDGKRYITNKFGCTNKWSIIEGKSALYFVDNINKAFCAFGGQGIEPLSDKLGFGTWFRRNNKTDAWNPAEFNNIVAFYDKIHSDVYLVKKNDSENQPCLVYNEALGTFTSFFDYANVPMMTNVDDRFVSFRDHKLWRQNEGMYCNFFNQQYGFWVQYRVTPEPFSDKIWTNIDYRADFYEVLNSGADAYVPEECLINGDVYDYNDDLYKEWETFTDYRVWDEYQDTGYTTFAHEKFDRDDVRKKFRIWRLALPRALKEGTNKHGMDRIRNPWINLLFRKEMSDGKYLMQLHDIVVKYFE